MAIGYQNQALHQYLITLITNPISQVYLGFSLSIRLYLGLKENPNKLIIFSVVRLVIKVSFKVLSTLILLD